MVVLRAVAEHKVRDDAVLETVDADQHGPERVDVRCVQVIPDLSVAVERTTYKESAPDFDPLSNWAWNLLWVRE